MTGPKKAHLVVIPFAAWGHLRPILHLTLQLLVVHQGLHATLLVNPDSTKRCNKELKSSVFASMYDHSQSAGDNAESVMDRIQLMNVTDEDFVVGVKVENAQKQAETFTKVLPAYVKALFGGDQAVLNDEVNKYAKLVPSCVLFDAVQGFVPSVIAQILETLQRPIVPILSFVPCGPTSMIDHLASEEDGGFLKKIKRLWEEGQAAGEDAMEVAGRLGAGDDGSIRKFPGLPPMTDYEYHPGLGSSPYPPPLVPVMLGFLDSCLSPHTTALIAPHVQEMEEEARVWFEDKFGKPYIAVGPQFPAAIWEGTLGPASENEDGQRVMQFLNRVRSDHGDDSLIYVSFGSAWFPFARPDIVHHILDTLIAAKFPFLFAYATEIFPVEPEILTKIEGYKDGMSVHVAPQMQVLHHPATGYFLSHCGANSMGEAILAGVPIVGLPFFADQGPHIHILKKYGAAIDLKQSKVFFGTKGVPKVLHDGTEYLGTEDAIVAELNDLWTELRGPLGEELRQGMKQLGDLTRKAWKDGTSRKAMEGVSRYF